MMIINIDDVTVVKNITEEEYEDSKSLIEKIVNRLILELLDFKGMIDIDDRTLVRVLRNSNDLVVSVDDMYFNRYYKERVVEAWFQERLVQSMEARTLDSKKPLSIEKKQALKIARELCYKAIVIEQIQKATTSMQITRALQAGRLGRL